ncbi:hypothetical protein XENOCAPTIV_014743 [Xenoophorus captivus]|uniref:Uncharacterized protein n=1 Tax=Xenoophorus captivus TaxID=1517983 RepID=A0ABV0QA22_9TELE
MYDYWSDLQIHLLITLKLCKYHSFIHSFIFYTAYPMVGHSEAGAYLQQSMGERHGTPWTGRQSIAGQHRDIQDKQPGTHSFTPKGNLERPINPKVMFLDCVRKPEYPVKTH